MKKTYEVGDVLICIDSFASPLVQGEKYTVADVCLGAGTLKLEGITGNAHFRVNRFELASEGEPVTSDITGGTNGTFHFQARSWMDIDEDKIQECLNLEKPFATMRTTYMNKDGERVQSEDVYVLVSDKVLEKTWYCKKGGKLRRKLEMCGAFDPETPMDQEKFTKLVEVCKEVYNAPLKKKFGKKATVEVKVHGI